jgi:hypothetical protein
MNPGNFPFSPGMTIYAENWQMLIDSWKSLLDEIRESGCLHNPAMEDPHVDLRERNALRVLW